MNVVRECPTRVSRKSVAHESTRVSYKSYKSVCRVTKVSHKSESVPQERSARVSEVFAFGFLGSILLHTQ